MVTQTMGAHPTLLLTGASGLVGAPLYRAAFERWRVVVVTHRRSAPAPLRRGDRAVQSDLLAPGAVEQLVAAHDPQAIVHAAALAALPACEADPAGALRLNVDVTARFARAAAACGAQLLLVSTDQVFAGDREWTAGGSVGYREDDPASPLHVYGRTKAAAEAAVRASGAEALIVRTALVLAASADGKSGALDLVRGATSAVRLFVDEWRTPVSVLDLARVVDEALRRRLIGTLHVAGPERVQRLELGSAIDAAFPLAAGKPRRELVAAERVAQGDRSSRRPRDVSLATVRLFEEGLPRPQPLAAALAELAALTARPTRT